MSIKISMYRHTDAKLWPIIGPFLTSREVVKSLGGPVLSDDSAFWWIATEGKTTVGFGCARESKDGWWLDCTYVAPSARSEGVHKAIAEARDTHLATLPAKPINVCCRSARWKHYADRGFQQTRVRGDWVYGRKAAKGAEE